MALAGVISEHQPFIASWQKFEYFGFKQLSGRCHCQQSGIGTVGQCDRANLACYGTRIGLQFCVRLGYLSETNVKTCLPKLYVDHPPARPILPWGMRGLQGSEGIESRMGLHKNSNTGMVP
jgi:hypothetical protein